MKNVINVIGSILRRVLCVFIIISLAGCANMLAPQGPALQSTQITTLGN
ncbi:hypothetical protein GPUN_0570 [Glaciecola punicea ACAM 611]|jgi:hypothetical protein|uniref:Lipoprotein n=1 Tax=Glaciecola punicea ACAM 611 TaxID=1121923 RepID=H5T8T7_9ALTE|nr:hypothetical protein [Glaciecola punicea]GAB54714.1 hypothetical protein GPUN_0570 [Glaciecola punicea ACAM 611]